MVELSGRDCQNSHRHDDQTETHGAFVPVVVRVGPQTLVAHQPPPSPFAERVEGTTSRSTGMSPTPRRPGRLAPRPISAGLGDQQSLRKCRTSSVVWTYV